MNFTLQQVCDKHNNKEKRKVLKRKRTLLLKAIDLAATGPGGRFTLGCGLEATLHRLDNPIATDIVTASESILNPWPDDPCPLAQRLKFYYAITIKERKDEISLILISSGAPDFLLLELHQKASLAQPAHVLGIIYENVLHSPYSRTGKTVLRSIEDKTSPKIEALIR
jgi:hypothetical protein